MAITQSKINAISRSLFMPIMLILDFGMFQYLVGVYFTRRHEWRVRMLLFASFIGFASHVYFHEDIGRVLDFNDISESCCQLVFLIQITIIGYAVRAKVKLRSIVWFTYVAEAFIALNWIDMAISAVEAAGYPMGNEMHTAANVLETVTLTFVPIFRFFYLSLSGGFWKVFQERKLEMVLYFIVATHELLFSLIAYLTGVTWEFAQGVYMRSAISACVLLNLRTKARKTSAIRATAVTSSNGDDPGPRRSFNVVLPVPSKQSVFKSGASSSNATRIGVRGPVVQVVRRQVTKD